MQCKTGDEMMILGGNKAHPPYGTVRRVTWVCGDIFGRNVNRRMSYMLEVAAIEMKSPGIDYPSQSTIVYVPTKFLDHCPPRPEPYLLRRWGKRTIGLGVPDEDEQYITDDGKDWRTEGCVPRRGDMTMEGRRRYHGCRWIIEDKNAHYAKLWRDNDLGVITQEDLENIILGHSQGSGNNAGW